MVRRARRGIDNQIDELFHNRRLRIKHSYRHHHHDNLLNNLQHYPTFCPLHCVLYVVPSFSTGMADEAPVPGRITTLTTTTATTNSTTTIPSTTANNTTTSKITATSSTTFTSAATTLEWPDLSRTLTDWGDMEWTLDVVMMDGVQVTRGPFIMSRLVPEGRTLIVHVVLKPGGSVLQSERFMLAFKQAHCSERIHWEASGGPRWQVNVSEMSLETWTEQLSGAALSLISLCPVNYADPAGAKLQLVGELLSAAEVLRYRGRTTHDLGLAHVDQLLKGQGSTQAVPAASPIHFALRPKFDDHASRDSTNCKGQGSTQAVPAATPTRSAPRPKLDDYSTSDSSSDTSDSSSLDDRSMRTSQSSNSNTKRQRVGNSGVKRALPRGRTPVRKKANVVEGGFNTSSLQNLQSPRARQNMSTSSSVGMRTNTTTTMSGSPKTPVGKTKPAITTIPKRLTPANRPPSRAPPPAAAPVAAPLEIRHDTKGSVCGLALTSDGNFFASAVNKFVYLWSTGEQGDYKAYWEGKRKVSCLAFVPRATMVADGYVLAIGAGLGVTLVHCSATSPFRVLTQFDFKGGVLSLSPTPCGSFLASGHKNNRVHIWAIPSDSDDAPLVNRPLEQEDLKLNDSAKLVLFAPGLAVVGTERRLASCSDKGLVKVWIMTVGMPVDDPGAGGDVATVVTTLWRTLKRSTCESSMALAWSPCARFLAVMERTATVSMYDTETEDFLWSVQVFGQLNAGLAFTPSGLHLCAATTEQLYLLAARDGGERKGKRQILDSRAEQIELKAILLSSSPAPPSLAISSIPPSQPSTPVVSPPSAPAPAALLLLGCNSQRLSRVCGYRLSDDVLEVVLLPPAF